MNQEIIWQLIRYALQGLGAFLVGRGYVTADNVTTIIGAVGSLFATFWGLYVKWGTQSVPAATAARSDVPTVNPATGATIPGSASK